MGMRWWFWKNTALPSEAMDKYGRFLKDGPCPNGLCPHSALKHGNVRGERKMENIVCYESGCDC